MLLRRRIWSERKISHPRRRPISKGLSRISMPSWIGRLSMCAIITGAFCCLLLILVKKILVFRFLLVITFVLHHVLIRKTGQRLGSHGRLGSSGRLVASPLNT